MGTVQGFLTFLDAKLIQAILHCQDETSINGHLCEIGVHHGRLFLMLALSRRPGERALAIDLFEDDNENANTKHAGRQRAFADNAERLGIKLSESEILKTSSLDISPADIVARITGLVRFFSVDGGHLYKHVENDLRLAEGTLAENGVIAVDDFFNLGWIDISFAVYDFLRTSELVPFAVSSKKIYLAASEAAEEYKLGLLAHPDIAPFETVRVLGREALLFKQSPFRKGYDLLRNTIVQHIR